MTPANAAVDSERVATTGNTHLTMREVRKLRGMSLRDVEAETGISRATLSKVERGIELPKVGHMLSLSDTYGVHPNDWFAVHEYRCLAEAVTP